MALDVAQLRAKVGLDATDLERGAMRARGVLGDLAGRFRNAAAEAATTAAGFLVRDVVIASWRRLTDAVRDSARELIDTNRAWESYTNQFTVQLGTAAAAAERLRELERFAIFAPGGLDDLIQADLVMQNFGLHAANAAQRWGQSGQEIRSIAANVAAGTKASFDEIAMWLGRFAVGDTGRAIMRFQELGAVTREELRQMGVEFDKAGSLVSPLDEAMTSILALMERKFGGLVEIQSRSLGGMREQLADWMSQQQRLWGQPVFDAYKNALGGLLGFLESEGVQRALEIGRDMWASLVGWLGDVARDWAAGLAGLAADALYWGANVVEQFAAGVTGSGAVSGALRQMADEVAAWLRPGSPPRIMPWLTEYGLGAARAYWEGWGLADPEISGWLNDAFKSLEPHLRAIEEAGGITDAGLAGFRGAFGDEAGRFEGYVQAYGGLVVAARVAAEAQVAYDAAVAEGDEEAIAAAQAQLDTAREQEQAAQRQVAAEQARIAQSMSAEARLARATEERANQEERAARQAADRDAEAERRRQEAEQKRVADARLRWELAVAETPEAQLEIWRRELAATEEGSAEYFDTLTRIVQLEQQIRDERERGGMGAGAGVAAGLAEDVEGELTKAGGGLRRAIDWAGIGKAIVEALWTGMKEELSNLASRFQEWAEEDETRTRLANVGNTIGGFVVDAIGALFGVEPEVDKTAGALDTHLREAVWKVGTTAWDLGLALGDSIIYGMASKLVNKLGGDGTPEEMEVAWEVGFLDSIVGGIGAKFGSAESAAALANRLIAIGQDPTVSVAARDAAETQAGVLIEKFGLTLEGGLVGTSVEAIEKLRDAQELMEVYSQIAGVHGRAYGNAVADAIQETLDERLPELDYNYVIPDSTGKPPERSGRGGVPGYAAGGLVTEPTLAWIGEEGPELVIPLPQEWPGSGGGTAPERGGGTNITIQIDARGANAREVQRGVLAGLRSAGVTA